MTQKNIVVILTTVALLFLSGKISAQETSDDLLPRTLYGDGFAVEIVSMPTSFDMDSLEKWMSDYRIWQDWESKNIQKRVLGTWSGRLLDRMREPLPPAFLYGECPQMFDGSNGVLFDGCQLFKKYLQSYSVEGLRAAIEEARDKKEKPKSTSFLDNVHLDFYWPLTASNAYRYGGLFGTHITLIKLGRIEPFGSPGLMVMRIPDQKGGSQIALGLDYGTSIRLMEFTAPFTTRVLVLHLNYAKVKLLTVPANVAALGVQSFAGFSTTFKNTK